VKLRYLMRGKNLTARSCQKGALEEHAKNRTTADLDRPKSCSSHLALLVNVTNKSSGSDTGTLLYAGRLSFQTHRVSLFCRAHTITTAFIFWAVRFSLLRGCSRDTHVHLSAKMSIHGQWNCIHSRRWRLTLSFDC
jgi:hypothetical protein